MIVDADSSVTRWQDYLFSIETFTAMKISPIAYKISQSRFKILLDTQATIKNWPKAFKFCERGEISPNLVTRRMPLALVRQ